MSASYPGSVKVFSNKNPGDVIASAHIDDLQAEVNAIEDGLLNGTAHLQSSNSTVAALSVTGASTFAGGITAQSDLDVAGNSSVHGTLRVTGASTYVGHAGFGAAVRISGGSTVVGSLSVGTHSTIAGNVVIGQSLTIGGSTSITLSTGNTNDLVVGADVFFLKLTGNSSGSTLTGIKTAAGASRLLLVNNISNTNIVLANQTGSNSSNQFAMTGNANLTLNALDGILLIYDVNAWRTAMS